MVIKLSWRATRRLYKTNESVDRIGTHRLQRWRSRGRLWPRGHVLKSLALASKPQVLENCLVLGSRTALFFWIVKILLESARNLPKNLRRPFLFFSFGDRLKKNFEDLFFKNTCALCPWSLASSIPFLGPEKVSPRKGCSWPWPRIVFVSLASSLVFSTPPMSFWFRCYNIIILLHVLWNIIKLLQVPRDNILTHQFWGRMWLQGHFSTPLTKILLLNAQPHRKYHRFAGHVVITLTYCFNPLWSFKMLGISHISKLNLNFEWNWL